MTRRVALYVSLVAGLAVVVLIAVAIFAEPVSPEVVAEKDGVWRCERVRVGEDASGEWPYPKQLKHRDAQAGRPDLPVEGCGAHGIEQQGGPRVPRAASDGVAAARSVSS